MSWAYFGIALGGIVAGLAGGMAFSALESAVLALNRIRLLRLFSDEVADASSEQEIFRDTKDTYALTRLGVNASILVVGLCCMMLSARVLHHLLPPDGAFGAFSRNVLLALVVTLVLVVPLHLLFVFAVPRFLGRRITLSTDAELPVWVRHFHRALHPLSVISRQASRLWHGLLLPHYHLTKNDVVALVTHLDLEDEEEDAADADTVKHDTEEEEETDEEEIIYNLLDLENTLVREVMKPINSVVAIRLEGATLKRLYALSRRTGYSRFPVYHDRIVDLVGYVNVYDALNSSDSDCDLEGLIEAPFFVPEFMRVSELLTEFRRREKHAAVVVDEYGGSSGWITREDVLEEIVGEIEDEFDARRNRIYPCEDGSYLIEGSLDIDDLAEELDLEIEDAEPQYDTVAGFILMRLGRIPVFGDSVPWGNANLIVERMHKNQIAQIRVRFGVSESRGSEYHST